MRDPAPPYANEGPTRSSTSAKTRRSSASCRASAPQPSSTSDSSGRSTHATCPSTGSRATAHGGRSGQTRRPIPATPRGCSATRPACVFTYRLRETAFEPHPEVGGYWVSRETGAPLEARPLGDLVPLHDDAEIELRVLPNLWPLWNAVVASTLEYSGMRLQNAQPAK